MINTDKKIIEEFLTRGVEAVYPSKGFLEKELKSGRQLRIYTGIDPTGSSAHLGHAVVFRKLAKLQAMGHKVIILIGNFTAKIGDPTDKGSARKQLTDDEVNENMRGYIDQLKPIFDFDNKSNPVEVRYNADWLGQLKFDDVLKLASEFTVQRMLERDMFEKRMKEEKPIYIHEFMYPLMQGYDSVALDVDLEIGGNDQTFNMLAGRTLMKSLKNKEKSVLTMELLVDDQGKKMSKTDNNFVALSDSASDMFGKVMSWTDSVIVNAFRILTDLTNDDINDIEKQLKKGANPRDLKVRLAYEVTRIYKGEAEANIAKDQFDKVFSKKEKPDVVETKFSAKNIITDALVDVGLVSSKNEAKRLIDQKGLKVDDAIVTTYDFKLKKGTHLIQKGKRHFLNISVE